MILNLASIGVKFLSVKDSIIEDIKNIENLDSTMRIIRLIDILNNLSKHKSFKTLSSRGAVINYHKTENKRLDLMYEYVFQNFNTPISAGDVAEKISMNKSAFSRYFKKIHRKSFTRYLNEIRIGYSCKLLIDGNESITSIAYLSGFNNISNFNRQFKLIKGESPSYFLRNYED